MMRLFTLGVMAACLLAGLVGCATYRYVTVESYTTAHPDGIFSVTKEFMERHREKPDEWGEEARMPVWRPREPAFKKGF